MKSPYLFKLTILTSIFGFLFNSNLAFAEQETNTTQESNTIESQPVKTGDSFKSEGQSIFVETLDLHFQTIKDWDVRVGNNSVMMKEILPQDIDPSKTVYDVPVYNKNVQIVVLNKALPLDEKRAIEVSNYLKEQVGNNPSIRGFQIDEMKFVDVHGKKDAVLYYTSMQHKDIKMRQMVILYGGANQQVIATYSDLADAFEKDSQSLDAAWNSMTNVALEGKSPSRYAAAYTYGPFAVGTFLILILLGAFKSASEKRAIKSADSDIFDEDEDLNQDQIDWNQPQENANSYHGHSPAFTSQF